MHFDEQKADALRTEHAVERNGGAERMPCVCRQAVWTHQLAHPQGIERRLLGTHRHPDF
jgi:hypothetical protein